MEFKGTKGRWSIDYLGKEPISVATDLPISGNVICVAPDELLPRSLENWHSNALLISKAPEMLEMLKKASYIFKECERMDNATYPIKKEIDQLIKEAIEL